MEKRKNGEASLTSERVGMIALGLGLVTLMIFSASAILWWLSRPPAFTNTYRPPSIQVTYIPSGNSNVSAPKITPAPPVAAMRLADAHFLFSTTDGVIMSNANGTGYQPTGLQGSDVTVAPDGRTLAYVREGRLYIYREGKEQRVKVIGDALMPAWSADGDALAFVVRASGGDSIYRVNIASMEPSRLLVVSEIDAPPLSNPATGRLLVVERLAAQKTAFYTIDPLCATQSACLQTRKDIATVSQTVSWASYHPSATSLVFADRNDGNLYMLATATGQVTPLPAIQGYKRRPVFSKDGTSLAYLNDGNQLYVLRLDNNRSLVVPFANVASADWAR